MSQIQRSEVACVIILVYLYARARKCRVQYAVKGDAQGLGRRPYGGHCEVYMAPASNIFFGGFFVKQRKENEYAGVYVTCLTSISVSR